MYKKIFFGLLILYIVLPLQAQYVVKGKIVDINKEEVPFSSIQLLGTDSVLVKGCISDSLGIFTFPNVQSRKYIVRISNVGYSTLYKGEFYQFNLSSCIRQQNSLTAQFVSFSLSNLANIFYPSQFLQ